MQRLAAYFPPAGRYYPAKGDSLSRSDIITLEKNRCSSTIKSDISKPLRRLCRGFTLQRLAAYFPLAGRYYPAKGDSPRTRSDIITLEKTRCSSTIKSDISKPLRRLCRGFTLQRLTAYFSPAGRYYPAKGDSPSRSDIITLEKTPLFFRDKK